MFMQGVCVFYVIMGKNALWTQMGRHLQIWRDLVEQKEQKKSHHNLNFYSFTPITQYVQIHANVRTGLVYPEVTVLF